ncbi:MAG: acyl-CoA dehydrogenase [SAR86 cluster bacterium]|uniref:Acyl-CoA dehydrogenase n=1 Tax=SAR86 cluster bacterium TaxID=2030880 RepID=A0A2A4MU40_9GAMM|nr:MAG: acyl-CoA dehydrogenase [SAR86 cluster bacterium]
MLDYAGLNCKGDKLVENIVLSFCAQMIQSVLQRLLSQSADINIARQEICQQMSGPQLSQLFERYHSADNLASIGAQLIQGDVDTLASSLDAEKQMVRETFSRFAADIVAPLAEDIHRQDLDIPDTILSQAAELGCFGTCIPERFGGLMPDDKPDSLSMIVVTEELSKASLGAAGSLITRPEIAARALLKGGTAAQQQRWLPPLASGETLCAIAITEPDYGSDVASMTLKASRTAGGWLLNGSKTWSTFAAKSGLLVVLARSNPDTSLGHKGLSLFFVEKPIYAGHEFVHQQNAGDFTSQPETVGKLSGKAIATIGYRGMHSYDLFFEDYFVPGENLLGENEGEGRGFYYTMAGFSGGRIQTAARATGVMQAAYEKALSYSKQRRVFKKVLADYQLTQVKLARMQMTITAARQFSYAVASLMDQGKGQMQASLVKLFACRAAEWISREAMQIHGGMGYAEESAVSRYFVDARVLSIFEGAEETLALKVIAKDLIAKAK